MLLSFTNRAMSVLKYSKSYPAGGLASSDKK